MGRSISGADPASSLRRPSHWSPWRWLVWVIVTLFTVGAVTKLFGLEAGLVTVPIVVILMLVYFPPERTR
jgi:uncharacterized membrane protein YfcA